MIIQKTSEILIKHIKINLKSKLPQTEPLYKKKYSKNLTYIKLRIIWETITTLYKLKNFN